MHSGALELWKVCLERNAAGSQVEVTGTLERMATSTSPAVPTSGKLHFTAYGVPADVSVNGAGDFGLLLPPGNYLISGTGTSAAGHGLCHVRQKLVVTPFEPLRVRVACA